MVEACPGIYKQIKGVSRSLNHQRFVGAGIRPARCSRSLFNCTFAAGTRAACYAATANSLTQAARTIRCQRIYQGHADALSVVVCRPSVLFLDNGSSRRSRLVLQASRAAVGLVPVVFPPFCPHLNRIETLGTWLNTTGCPAGAYAAPLPFNPA